MSSSLIVKGFQMLLASLPRSYAVFYILSMAGTSIFRGNWNLRHPHRSRVSIWKHLSPLSIF
jgi:hypothetical protein